MAEVKEIICSRSCRVNLGNYEGVEFFLSMRVELDAFDDEAEEAGKLADKVEAAMVERLVSSTKLRGKAMSREKVIKHYGLKGT